MSVHSGITVELNLEPIVFFLSFSFFLFVCLLDWILSILFPCVALVVITLIGCMYRRSIKTFFFSTFFPLFTGHSYFCILICSIVDRVDSGQSSVPYYNNMNIWKVDVWLMLSLLWRRTWPDSRR